MTKINFTVVAITQSENYVLDNENRLSKSDFEEMGLDVPTVSPATFSINIVGIKHEVTNEYRFRYCKCDHKESEFVKHFYTAYLILDNGKMIDNYIYEKFNINHWDINEEEKSVEYDYQLDKTYQSDHLCSACYALYKHNKGYITLSDKSIKLIKEYKKLPHAATCGYPLRNEDRSYENKFDLNLADIEDLQ